MQCYFVVDVGMEMSRGATHHNELDHIPLHQLGNHSVFVRYLGAQVADRVHILQFRRLTSTIEMQSMSLIVPLDMEIYHVV